MSGATAVSAHEYWGRVSLMWQVCTFTVYSGFASLFLLGLLWWPQLIGVLPVVPLIKLIAGVCWQIVLLGGSCVCCGIQCPAALSTHLLSQLGACCASDNSGSKVLVLILESNPHSESSNYEFPESVSLDMINGSKQYSGNLKYL